MWTHARMVCEALAEMAAWRALPAEEREIVFGAALLHDVAKPVCTRRDNAGIHSRGHSRRGAIEARSMLWRMGADFAAREQVCAMARYHLAPFHLVNRSGVRRLAFRISLTARCDLLGLLARADALGRVSGDQAELLDRVELFEEYCREQQCFRGPRQFPSGRSRFLYFRGEGRDPEYAAYDEARCEAAVMSGLPGSGKDAWIAKYLPGRPAASLDAIRDELGVSPARGQGAVVDAARRRARALIRDGRDFVWNATNVSRALRERVVEFLAAYPVRVRIVYVEASFDAWRRQSRNRERAVPEKAVERMLRRWEPPDCAEGDQVEWWVDGEQVPAIV
ncbi:MAG: AAA family ATPase [Bryobacteraceae bacterium]|nr:AAA family ATPase [Bryobacteraceae bacterium]